MWLIVNRRQRGGNPSQGHSEAYEEGWYLAKDDYTSLNINASRNTSPDYTDGVKEAMNLFQKENVDAYPSDTEAYGHDHPIIKKVSYTFEQGFWDGLSDLLIDTTNSAAADPSYTNSTGPCGWQPYSEAAWIASNGSEWVRNEINDWEQSQSSSKLDFIPSVRRKYMPDAAFSKTTSNDKVEGILKANGDLQLLMNAIFAGVALPAVGTSYTAGLVALITEGGAKLLKVRQVTTNINRANKIMGGMGSIVAAGTGIRSALMNGVSLYFEPTPDTASEISNTIDKFLEGLALNWAWRREQVYIVAAPTQDCEIRMQKGKSRIVMPPPGFDHLLHGNVTKEDVVRESYWHYEHMAFYNPAHGNRTKNAMTNWADQAAHALDESIVGISAGYMFNIPVAFSYFGQIFVEDNGKRNNFPCRTGMLDIRQKFKGPPVNEINPEESNPFIQATGIFEHKDFWKDCKKKLNYREAPFKRPGEFVRQPDAKSFEGAGEFQYCDAKKPEPSGVMKHLGMIIGAVFGVGAFFTGTLIDEYRDWEKKFPTQDELGPDH
ncbi:uncharacterized protein BDZ99DRAFT_495212 [Mytilinidion resinicola]|uniref:Uncharacterized protein n=1 Tax=Mytilinidion resinicola TaxID=574789 RepID=A0A6A6Z484_9PEZI|nr:uncharacterized protein BDZ99DRAFT_495212 [Mytilinidion resinicola]KAF2815463.1 hypothetical protein BDZ99DRAFT_495212 [Mytilinidion resinicola]